MTSRIAPIMPSRRWEVLTAAQLDRIREAIFTVLAQVGVRFPLTAALDILEAHGAVIDRASRLARLPRGLVETALAAAPREFTLCGREPACDLLLDGRHCYLSNDASGVFVVDPASGARRPSTLADVADSARFVDALPEVAFAWGPIVAAGDTPAGSRALHEAAAVLANTTKHFQAVTCVGERPARLLVELAAAVSGGRDELRRRPLVSLIACPVDPLGNDAVSLEAGLVCAAAGVPCGFLSLTLGGGTAPATLAANLVVNGAAVLADLVLLQLASPGAPVFFAGAPSVMDLRTGGYTGGGPEDDVLAAAATQVGRSFGLPVNMGTMATGAKEPGWQAGVDDALSTAASVLAGADMMSGAGMLDGSRTLSYPHLVMETELYRIVARLAQGIIVNDETLALDAIRRVGPNGTYLADKHTRRHLREIWQPAVWDRTSYDAWLAGGKRGALESAAEQAREILDSHVSAPLPDEVAAELRAIVARADGEFELSAVVGRVDTELS
jgi:trimethylamine--corrinoid protein Co-methyltransferase